MTVSAVNNSYYTTPATTSGSTGSSGLTETDFLDLLVDQLKNQDPDQPEDPSQFAAQLAQFSTVEELTNLNQTMQSLEMEQASSLIGKTVSVTSGSGAAVSGMVQKVTYDSTNGVQVVINGTSYGLASVTEID